MMSNSWKNLLAASSLLICLTLIFGLGLVNDTFIWVLLGGMVLFAFLQHKNYRRNLLVVSIWGIWLGWRGLDLAGGFIVYPTEFFIWFGILIYLIDQTLQENAPPKLGRFETLLFVFAVLGMFTSWNNKQSISQSMIVFSCFVVFLPMMVLFRSWIHEKSEVLLYARWLAVAGAVIAIIGLVERYVPQLDALFPTNLSSAVESRYNFEMGSEIELAAFNFWGTPVVSVFLVISAGLAAVLPRKDSAWQKYGWPVMFSVLAMGIVASGYRSAWLGLALVVILMLFLNHSQIWVSLVWIIPGVLYLFSSAYLDRFQTMVFMFRGSSQDPTFIRRSVALKEGIQSLQAHPLLGVGWNSPTTFNDWANIGVWMGLPGLLFFTIGYGWLLFSLFRLARKTDKKDDRLLFLAFFTALAGYAAAMVSGAMSQVFPLMAMFWFAFCLAWRLVEISRQEKI